MRRDARHSLVVLVVCVALIGVAWAALRDTVNSSATFVAGSLYFGSAVVTPIEFSDVVPGWTSVNGAPTPAGMARLRNAGSTPGVLRLSVERLVDTENDVTPAEARLVPADTVPDGEVAGALHVAIYDNASPEDPASVPFWQGTLAQLVAASPLTIDPSFGASCTTGEQHTIAWKCWIPTSVGNEIQTDSLSCDIVYSLDQW